MTAESRLRMYIMQSTSTDCRRINADQSRSCCPLTSKISALTDKMISQIFCMGRQLIILMHLLVKDMYLMNIQTHQDIFISKRKVLLQSNTDLHLHLHDRTGFCPVQTQVCIRDVSHRFNQKKSGFDTNKHANFIFWGWDSSRNISQAVLYPGNIKYLRALVTVLIFWVVLVLVRIFNRINKITETPNQIQFQLNKPVVTYAHQKRPSKALQNNSFGPTSALMTSLTIYGCTWT